MARNLIPLKKIGNMFDEQVQDLVKRTTLLWASELQTRQPPNLGTPVDTGVLRQSWTVNVDQPYTGRIINNMEYARPVMYGIDMPPSWQGKWRTAQGAKKGFPDLLGKELSRKHVPRLMRVITQGR